MHVAAALRCLLHFALANVLRWWIRLLSLTWFWDHCARCFSFSDVGWLVCNLEEERWWKGGVLGRMESKPTLLDLGLQGKHA